MKSEDEAKLPKKRTNTKSEAKKKARAEDATTKAKGTEGKH